MTKAALIGYGQMGRLLEKMAPRYDIEIVTIIDPLLNNSIDVESLKDCDICIEFTEPGSVVENIRYLAEAGKNIVVGTTGWQDYLPEVQQIVRETGIGLVHSSNFSLGMNLFFLLTDYFSRLMNKLPEYDVWGLEKHHKYKADSPSGTAKVLSDILVKNLSGKTTAQFERIDRKIELEEIHFASIRSGEIPGEHIVGFDSTADSIEIKHTARNREGLAAGTLKAALWIEGKKGIFNFKEIFPEILQLAT